MHPVRGGIRFAAHTPNLGKGIRPEQVAKAAASARKVGLNVSIYLITGVDGETEDDIDASVKLVETIRPHDGQVSPLAYFPGTEAFPQRSQVWGNKQRCLYQRQT